MADSFTEVTSKNWFSRIGYSFKGIIFGLIVITPVIVLLWWNEGRAITTANSLKEGAAAVVSVSSDKLDPANDKKLIRIIGEATAANPAKDLDFGIGVPAPRLVRTEEIYQWLENQTSETKQKVGGGEETTTTYTDEKQ